MLLLYFILSVFPADATENRRHLSADEEAEILKAIDDHWEELNKLIDQVFAGKKIQIKQIK